MKLQILWLSFILWTNRVQSTSSAESFISCSRNFEPSGFYVMFDCALLDDRTSHRNYFDKNVINNTCNTTEGWRNTISMPFSSAAKVTLMNCRLPILPHHFLQRLDHARTINLYRCGISTINNATFAGGLMGLNEISMSQNDLTELPGFLFSQNPNITEFDVSSNRISNIDPNTFRGTISKLKIVDLSRNSIETIDEKLFVDAVNLVVLNLGHNFIEHFRVDLTKLKDLSVLRLDNNQISRLDCTIFDLTTNKIGILVNYNHIREIDFNCTVHLESLVLDVNDNQLTSLMFPKSSLLDSLNSLHASRNHIRNITFKQPLRQLSYLHLDANNLKDLAGWDEATFPQLQYLDITGHQFNCSYLKAFLKRLPKTIELVRSGSTDDIRHTTKRSKMIHGISCNDVVEEAIQPDHTDAAVERTIIWCLIAFLAILFVAALSMKVGKIVRKCRSDRADPLSVYYQNKE